MTPLTNSLLAAVAATIGQLVLLLPGVALALVHYYVAGAAKHLATALFGLGFYYFTAIGVALHELGHAILAYLFGHQVIDVRLFGPDPVVGTAGYVRHLYDRRNLYQSMGNFFIGIGPLIFGAVAIYLAAAWLLGDQILGPIRRVSVDASSMASAGALEAFIRGLLLNAREVLSVLLQRANWTHWQFYVFLYLAFAIGANMHLSLPDLAGMWSGVVALVVVMLILNLITLALTGSGARYSALISQGLSAFYGFLLLAIVLTGAFLVILFAISLLRAPRQMYT